MIIDNTNGEYIKIDLEPHDITQEEGVNPDNPKAVHTIKGNNTIIISNEDGTKSQSYTINLGSLEYSKIGNYKDLIFKNTADSPYYDNTLLDDEWYYKNVIKKLVLTGSENWEKLHYAYTLKNFFYAKTYSQITDLKAYSDYFVWSTTGQSDAFVVSFWYHSGGRSLRFIKDKTPNITNFKNWLSENPVTVYYILETPTYTHLSEENYSTLKSQLDDLYNNAKSYKGKTIISQNNTDLSFNINYNLYVKNENIRDTLYDINEFLRVNL